MYVVSKSTKRHIISRLVVPQDEHLAILGSFNKHNIMRKAKDALAVRSRFMDEKEAVPLDEPKVEYVKNEATGRMIKVGSRKYKQLYANAK